MKALISPNEKVVAVDGIVLGVRVAQISETEFEVSEPLFWSDCPDECLADVWYYNEGSFFVMPAPMTPPDPEFVLPTEEPTANN